MHFDKLFPGRFIKAGDFEGRDTTLTISAVKLEKMEGSRKAMEAIISFKESPKDLGLNKTNGLCLRHMFGSETEKWVGKRVTFYPAPNNTGMGDSDVMVRVRGSPDIEKDTAFDWTPPRKKTAQTFHLKKTGGAPAANATPPKAPANPAFAMLQDLAKLNQIPWAKVGEWLKARGRTNGASVTTEDVEAYKALLAAEPMPPQEDAPF